MLVGVVGSWTGGSDLGVVGGGRDFWSRVRKSRHSAGVDSVPAMVCVGGISVGLAGTVSSEGTVDGDEVLNRSVLRDIAVGGGAIPSTPIRGGKVWVLLEMRTTAILVMSYGLDMENLLSVGWCRVIGCAGGAVRAI